MPNLVGIWNSQLPERAIRRTIDTQLARVRVASVEYQEFKYVADGFGMALMDHGLLENGVQPARSADGRHVLLLDGEIANADELRRRYRHILPSHDVSAPELCLHLLSTLGIDAVSRLNGQFCIAMYDNLERKLALISDRLGFRSLFYKARPGSLLFGTELKAIAAADDAPREIDEAGTLELFAYGSQFRERTWLKDCVRLLPATVLEFSEHGTSARRYWMYKYDERARTLDQPTYYTGFATLLDRAVERAMRGSKRIGIFLSGGYDSRSVAASIRPQHLPIPAFTFGLAESRDMKFAALLARRLGLDHQAVANEEPYLKDTCHGVVWRTEGMSSFASATSIRYHARMKEKMDIFLTGFLGEFGGSHTWPALLLARTRKEAMDAIYRRTLAGAMGAKSIFNPAFFKRVYEEVRARFTESFETVENDHPLDMADSWNFLHLQPRSTFQVMSVDRHMFEVRAPHTDADLVDFLLRIPPYQRFEQRVYKQMIAYRFPEIRDIACTNSGRAIDPVFAREMLRMSAQLVRTKAAGSLRRLLRLREPLGRGPRDLQMDFRREPAIVEDVLRPMLAKGVFPESIFDCSAIARAIEDHYSGRAANASLLSLLISWGLAVEYFINDDRSRLPEGFRPA